jgi:hypothetical protein
MVEVAADEDAIAHVAVQQGPIVQLGGDLVQVPPLAYLAVDAAHGELRHGRLPGLGRVLPHVLAHPTDLRLELPQVLG